MSALQDGFHVANYIKLYIYKKTFARISQQDTTDVFLVQVQNAADANTTIGDSNIHINVNQGSNIKNLAALIYKDNSAFQPPPNSTS